MSAEQICDEWFSGPKDEGKRKNPREMLKGLGPVSLQGRIDFNIGTELGTLKGTKFELKYLAWGLYPPRELQELLTMFRISFIKKAIAEYEQQPGHKSQRPEIPEEVIQKRLAKAKSFHMV
jgi:hypothetical protein